MKRYEYDAILHETADNGGAFVAFPWDVRQALGKGRVKVHAQFGGIPYVGQVLRPDNSEEKRINASIRQINSRRKSRI